MNTNNISNMVFSTATNTTPCGLTLPIAAPLAPAPARPVPEAQVTVPEPTPSSSAPASKRKRKAGPELADSTPARNAKRTRRGRALGAGDAASTSIAAAVVNDADQSSTVGELNYRKKHKSLTADGKAQRDVENVANGHGDHVEKCRRNTLSQQKTRLTQKLVLIKLWQAVHSADHTRRRLEELIYSSCITDIGQLRAAVDAFRGTAAGGGTHVGEGTHGGGGGGSGGHAVHGRGTGKGGQQYYALDASDLDPPERPAEKLIQDTLGQLKKDAGKRFQFENGIEWHADVVKTLGIADPLPELELQELYGLPASRSIAIPDDDKDAECEEEEEISVGGAVNPRAPATLSSASSLPAMTEGAAGTPGVNSTMATNSTAATSLTGSLAAGRAVPAPLEYTAKELALVANYIDAALRKNAEIERGSTSAIGTIAPVQGTGLPATAGQNSRTVLGLADAAPMPSPFLLAQSPAAIPVIPEAANEFVTAAPALDTNVLGLDLAGLGSGADEDWAENGLGIPLDMEADIDIDELLNAYAAGQVNNQPALQCEPAPIAADHIASAVIDPALLFLYDADAVDAVATVGQQGEASTAVNVELAGSSGTAGEGRGANSESFAVEQALVDGMRREGFLPTLDGMPIEDNTTCLAAGADLFGDDGDLWGCDFGDSPDGAEQQ